MIAVVFMLLIWSRSSRTNRGPIHRSLSRRTILTLGCGIIFVAGEVYLSALSADLRWPRVWLFLAEVSWGVLLGSGVWYRPLRKSRASEPGPPVAA